MNNLKKIFTLFLVFVCFYILFSNNLIINKSVLLAFSLWLTKVFPSLFIMFILNDIIINSNILLFLNNFISPIFNKIFHTSGTSSLAFLLAIFSGTPAGAFIIKEMLMNKQISKEDANKLISFTFFSNPLFLYNILSLNFNHFITFKIIIIHYLANLFIGLFYRGKKNSENKIIFNKNNSKPLYILIPSAINKSFNILLTILGTITFYMIITNILINIIPFSNTGQIIIQGFFEITQALNSLNILNTASTIKEIIAIALISFGGLSIHTQVLTIISDTNISYKNFFFGRILHVLISTSSYLFITYCFIG